MFFVLYAASHGSRRRQYIHWPMAGLWLNSLPRNESSHYTIGGPRRCAALINQRAEGSRKNCLISLWLTHLHQRSVPHLSPHRASYLHHRILSISSPLRGQLCYDVVVIILVSSNPAKVCSLTDTNVSCIMKIIRHESEGKKEAERKVNILYHPMSAEDAPIHTMVPHYSRAQFKSFVVLVHSLP